MKRAIIIAEKDYKEIKKDLDNTEKELLELIHLDESLSNYKDRVNILGEILFSKVRNIKQLLSEED